MGNSAPTYNNVCQYCWPIDVIWYSGSSLFSGRHLAKKKTLTDGNCSPLAFSTTLPKLHSFKFRKGYKETRWHRTRPLRQVAIVKLSDWSRNNDFCLQMNDAGDLLNCGVKWPAAGDQWAEAERVRRTYTPGGQSPVVTQHRSIGGWRGSLDPDHT